MKICIVCGTITQHHPTYCAYCKNIDLRTVTSMKISIGKFEGMYEFSDEENKFLKILDGIEIIKNDD